jgi:hypothetical protein
VFLLRDLVSARTWLPPGNVLAGCVTGLVSFLVIVIGVSVGIGTLPAALAGVLAFGCVLRPGCTSACRTRFSEAFRSRSR